MKFGVEQPVIDFLLYPPIGPEDQSYAFGSARVRAMESGFLNHSLLSQAAQAKTFTDACDIFAGTDYDEISQSRNMAAVERVLSVRLKESYDIAENCVHDKKLIEVLKSKNDLVNVRLALRRVVTQRNNTDGYSELGNVTAEDFCQAVAMEKYDSMPKFVQDCIEQAILNYYDSRDIRHIDYAVDQSEAEYRIEAAEELGIIFLTGYFRTVIDLTNIRTLLRLKWSGDENKDVFVEGGYLDTHRLARGITGDYDAIRSHFYGGPYYEIVEAGTNYLVAENSFIGLEKMCDAHRMGFLKETQRITTGPQPIISFLLRREQETRMVRMILTGKNNNLDADMLLDRLPEYL